MGNFAENLNLGNRFRPPPPRLPIGLHELNLTLENAKEITQERQKWTDIVDALETSLICILLSVSRDVHFDKRMICFLSGLL